MMTQWTSSCQQPGLEAPFLDHSWMIAAQREVDERNQRAFLSGRSSTQRANMCPLGVLAALSHSSSA